MPHEGRDSSARRNCVAVVGATGAVGRELLGILAARGIAREQVRAIASSRSAGSTIEYGAGPINILPLDDTSFAQCLVAIFAVGAETSRRYAPIAAASGAVVIDNSSAFRLDPGVPLIVPEVHGWHGIPTPVRLQEHATSESRLGEPAHRSGIVANPNCTTIILVTALEPLRRAFGIEAIDIATYQAVSGAGAAAIDELLDTTRRALGIESHRSDARVSIFPEPCAFNVFSHDSAVDPDTGINGEEQKIIDETRKIWHDPTLRITPTCVRVPVLRAHTEAITVTLDEPATEHDVRAALAAGKGLQLVDDRAANRFPTPRNADGRDEVLVGRLRADPGEMPDTQGRRRRWCLLACGDQLRKGAALNAVQIAEGLGVLPEAQILHPLAPV